MSAGQPGGLRGGQKRTGPRHRGDSFEYQCACEGKVKGVYCNLLFTTMRCVVVGEVGWSHRSEGSPIPR